MFAFLSSSTELRRFSKGVLPKLAVVVLLFIPLLYGALYLWAFWDPTGNMNHLPVALVNEDKGAVVDGTETNAGDKITSELQKRGDLDWQLTDAAEAQSGVADGDFYFSVTIPADFSEAVTSPAGDSPESAQIQVYYNDANSFLASTLGKSAMLQLRDTVATEIGSQQVNSVLVGLNKASDGFSSAADGAGQLAAGTSTAVDGSNALTVGLNTLVSGMSQLESGSATLASGATKVDSGATTLAKNLATAKSGSASLASGTAQLSSGASTLSSSLSQLKTSITQPNTGLAAGASQLANGLELLDSGVNDEGGLVDSTQQLADGASQVSGGVDSMLAQSAKLVSQTDPSIVTALDALSKIDETSLSSSDLAQLETAKQYLAGIESELTSPTAQQKAQALQAGAANVASGLTSLESSLTTSKTGLADSVSALAAGASSLDSAVNVGTSDTPSLVSAVTKLSSGASTLASGASDANSGAKSLASGVSKLATGANTLASGTSTLADGAGTLSQAIASAAPGTTQLASGSTKLESGLTTIEDGTKTLQSSLEDGAKQTDVGSTAAVDAKSDVIADPVVLDTTYEHQAEGFGEGFAPFFISLALFVGGIITWLLLHALPRRALAAGVSGFRATMAGFVPAAVFGVGQVLIMLGVLILGLHLQANYVAGTILFTLLTVFAFLALQQMFIITMGTAAGRVMSLALLMFQLSSSGGTYPVQTTPDFFQAISPWMPITYVVTGLRQLITGELDARLWLSVAVLAGILIVSLAISSFAAGRQRVWTIARLHPELSI